MTWWAAALGFIGALAGSWGGQLIASGREDRRWDREREREDIRAQRDHEKEIRERAHDMKVQWRAERKFAYAELLAVLTSWQEVFLSQTIRQYQTDDTSAKREILEARRALVGARDPVRDALAQVDLVGSPKAAEQAHMAIRRIHSIEDDWFRNCRDLQCEGVMSHCDQWSLLIGQFREILRADLGVTKGAGVDLKEIPS
jgi:hypothetical protein